MKWKKQFQGLTVVDLSAGNAQGKFQPADALPGYRSPYLRRSLWGGTPLVITIPPSPRPLMQSECAQLCCSFTSHLYSVLERHDVIALLSKGEFETTTYFDLNEDIANNPVCGLIFLD